jgi:DENN domain-containing protein 1
MLMQMFVSLLHERKIILIHNESSKNAILIEALISLLYPLQWNFTNISYLIPSMVEYLEAPFPYIVGLPRDLWKYIYEQKWDILGDEVVAFDIDNNRTYEKEELPEFP